MPGDQPGGRARKATVRRPPRKLKSVAMTTTESSGESFGESASRNAPLIGASMPRVEDRAFLGAGAFTADLSLPGQAHAIVVRSPHAHAELGAIDTAAALAVPGVLAVYTAADLRAAGVRRSTPQSARRAPCNADRGCGPASRCLRAKPCCRSPMRRTIRWRKAGCAAGEAVAFAAAETEAAALRRGRRFRRSAETAALEAGGILWR